MSESEKIMDYGVIVILDALGSKGIWKSSDIKEVLEIWEIFIQKIEETLLRFTKKEKVDFSINAFSDTIILTFKNAEPKKLLKIGSRAVRYILSLGVPTRIFLRGTISIGKFKQSSKMILGPAIDEAAERYEKDDWIGVSATPSVYSYLVRFKGTQNWFKNFDFIEYKIPRKGGSVGGWAVLLDYTFKFDKKHIEKNFPGCKTLLDCVHFQLENSNDPSGAEKWKNTLDFILFLKSKKIDFKPAE